MSLSAQVAAAPARPAPRAAAPVPGPATAPPPRPARPAPAAQERPGRLVTAYAVFVMLLGTGAFTSMVGFDVQGPVFALWGCAYVVALAGLFDDRFRRRRTAGAPVLLVGVVLLTAASPLWSVAPDLTQRRSIGLVGTVLVGLFLARRFRPVQLFDVLRLTVLVLAVLSLLLLASGSPLALDPVHGTLRGVLVTKNTLGRVLALGILAAAAVALLDRARTRRAVLSAVPMLLALSLTASTGGMVVAAAALLVAAVVALLRDRRGPGALAGLGALAVGVACVVVPRLSAETVAGAIGEDVTLTGRTEIWAEALRALAQRPVLGHGYGAFWAASDQAVRIRTRLQWDVPNGHNGLLDVGLDLGLVGVALVGLLLVGLVVRGLRDLRAGRAAAGALRLAVAGITVSANLVETGLLQQNTLYTLLLVAALAAGDPRRVGARRRVGRAEQRRAARPMPS
ncbi:O-antigen ligase family protein [Kineococcus gypseus]|uniref:O-antigen ligase family protein n=1 Tax=Kineococcus gypseus TaxID=1637102 RepID=UPI003D7C4383